MPHERRLDQHESTVWEAFLQELSEPDANNQALAREDANFTAIAEARDAIKRGERLVVLRRKFMMALSIGLLTLGGFMGRNPGYMPMSPDPTISSSEDVLPPDDGSEEN